MEIAGSHPSAALPALERAIWDQAEASLVFASGMAAISTTLWAYARPGTVIIHSGPVYGGTDFLLKKILPQFGVTAIGFLSEGGRMTAAAEGARKVAVFLNTHPKVASVWYLGFLPEGHPDRPSLRAPMQEPRLHVQLRSEGG